MEYTIATRIKANRNRMKKLASINNFFNRRIQARNYIVAECRLLKVKLSEAQIVRATVNVVNATI